MNFSNLPELVSSDKHSTKNEINQIKVIPQLQNILISVYNRMSTRLFASGSLLSERERHSAACTDRFQSVV